MGHVKSEKLANGNLGVEITYGGHESPFGGVDTSAPPAYIDPKCFVDANGFLVVDNKLVAVSLKPVTTPTLWSGTAGVTLLTFGTFYSSLYGQMNYALGYIATRYAAAPARTDFVFYLTAWPLGSFPAHYNDVLPITLYDGKAIISTASITLDAIATKVSSTSTASGAVVLVTAVTKPSGGSITALTCTGGTGYSVGQYLNILQNGEDDALIQVNTVTFGAVTSFTLITGGGPGALYVTGAAATEVINNASISLKISGPVGAPATYSIPAWDTAGYNRQALVAAMVTQINAAPGDLNVSASASVDGYSLILTALVAGISGNTITVQDLSTNADASLPPPFYFSCRTARNLAGGHLTFAQAPAVITVPVSATAVGGTLYIAGLGPFILKYSGPGTFTTSTMYNGMGVLRKFEDSLIGLRLQGQLGTLTQNQDMIFAWTTGGELDEWAPVDVNGNVTGAGFAQLADIADYLSGLIVSNGTAFILRSQGISYATVTGNGSEPFSFAHIGLGDTGEGAGISSLISQYDQTGAYVGNTDIFQVSGSITAIGQKIKAALFADLVANTDQLSATVCPVTIGGDVFPLVVFLINEKLYLYNPTNGTWMLLNYTIPGTYVGLLPLTGTFASGSPSLAGESALQTVSVLAMQTTSGTPAVPVAPTFQAILEGVPNANSISQKCSITFPQEELSFGRDITIDALYGSLVANVSENVQLTFYINGVSYATYTLTPAQFNSLTAVPTEIQIFPSTLGAGAKTAHSPQLRVEVASISDAGIAQIRFVKLSEFGSFDPVQRPV